MNFTRKAYTTRNEKILDFVIGFLGWFLLNGLLYAGVIGITSTVTMSDSIGIILLTLPLLINIGLLIFLGFWRRWIALGALVAFALLLLAALVIGILVYAICFSSGSSI
ncbi:MAG: hypothetical protein IPP13_23855 [Kouleothrix sp.]|nr:hypothetical protein [Kouleothrix sp.]